MKFSITSVLVATLATAVVADQLPDAFTLKFTNRATGESMGRLALDSVYHAHLDPIGPSSPAVIIRKGDGGGIKFPQPWTDRFPPEPMTRNLVTGGVQFFSDLPNDPHTFVKVGDVFGYNDSKGLQTTWFACEDLRLSPLLSFYWRNDATKKCVEITALVVPL